MVDLPPPRLARLFYDPGCGPCVFFARASAWASRSRLEALPYDGPEAGPELGDLPEEVRFSYAHLVDQGGRRTGDAIMTPLVGWTVGPAGERIVAGVPPFDRGLRWLYGRFWEYRRTRGCAAPTGATSR